MDKVWVLYLDEETNEHVKVFTTESRARQWLSIWVKENWAYYGPREECDPDTDPIDLFFRENESCWYYLGECPVEE